MEKYFYVAVDEDGVLRPMAFIYAVGEAGELAKQRFLEKNEDMTVAKVQLVIIND